MSQTLQNQEVQGALKVLAQHGLGAMHIHAHDQNGDITPLPEGIVQWGNDLQVSFVSKDDPRLKEATPVASQWKNGKTVVTAYCTKNHGRCIINT